MHEHQNHEMVTVKCNECGDELEVSKRNARHFENGDAKCEACHKEEMRREWRQCLDPDYDGRMSRAKALERLKREERLPIVDHDGARIEAVEIEYGRGIGAEPDGHWVEKIEAIIECPECGYPRAKDWFKANAGQHRQRRVSCPDCGFTDEHF